tara:strand:- start:835 stop:1119 length:285 start_codon:yes stop_codon:yes gene_type:complete
MFPASFIPYLTKLIAPKLTEVIAQHVAKMFKLPQILDYMELPNDADKRIDKLETQIQMIAEDSHPRQDFDERIVKLEEFEQQVRRKKAFKRKDG